MNKVVNIALFTSSLLLLTSAFGSGVDFDAGADLRIRQEIFDNVPGCPGGGLVRTPSGRFTDHIRFRPRVWGELKSETENAGKFRLYARLADEFRWNIEPYKNTTSWPGELMLDNLFLEGKGLFGGFLDFRIGRQDLWNYCGIDHVFVDGTPGDGSRSIYTDMAALKFHVDDENDLDVFGLYNFDNVDDLRWGYDHQRTASLAARFPNGDGDQDDFGYGAIWTSRCVEDMPWQVFAMQKRTLNYGKAFRDHTELVGAKVMPRWDENFSSVFEVMSELNEEWSAYADITWKSTGEGMRPYVNFGYHFLSKEWDPMWSRGVNDSELFLYGTHDGVAWWSNMHFFKLTAGVEFGPNHSLSYSSGAIIAAEADHVGGGSGFYKGSLRQLKYSFPLFGPKEGVRFQALGHLLFEYFNPGDYYESERGSWFFRWQLEFRF